MDTNLTNLAAIAPRFRRAVSGNNDPSLTQVGASEFESSLEQGSAVAAAGAVLDYDVPAQFRHVRYSLTNTAFTITAANDFGGVAFANLPDSNLCIVGAEINGTFSFGGDYAANDDVVFGIGTAAAAANPVATTAVNVIPATNLTDIVLAGVSVAAVARASAVGAFSGLYVPDAPGNQLFLNASSTDTQLAADGSVTFNGTIDVFYMDFGNRGS